VLKCLKLTLKGEKMLKAKRLLSILALFLSITMISTTSAFADDQPTWEKGDGDVNVLLYYRPGGAYDRMNQSVIIPTLGADYGEVKAIRGCAKMIDYLRNTDEKVFGIWDWFSTNVPKDGEKNPCHMEMENIVSIAYSFPYHACHVKDAPGRGLDDFMNRKGIKVGINGNGIYKGQAAEVILSINPSAKIIPYSSSRKYLPGLKTGEVDYLYAAQSRDWMTCFASTDVNETGMLNFSEISDSEIADKNTYPVFVAFNMSMKEATAIAKKIHGSEALMDYFEKVDRPRALPKEVKYSRNKQLKFLKNWHQGLLDLM